MLRHLLKQQALGQATEFKVSSGESDFSDYSDRSV
jgi:hypothetical protein